MVSATRQRFNQEFRRNLDAGNKTFEFEGKTYSTKMLPPAPKVEKIESSNLGSNEQEKEPSPQTEAQRVGESRSDLIKQRDMLKKTQPTERTDKMFDDLLAKRDDYKTSLQQQGYKKGGAVKKAGGGSVRGCGIATKGRGKMRML